MENPGIQRRSGVRKAEEEIAETEEEETEEKTGLRQRMEIVDARRSTVR